MANDYKVDSIKVLSDIEHIRTRPGMYIGELDVPPLALFNEAIDNAFDEAQNDPKSETIVKITEENGLFKYSIRDHGRGIPIGEINLPDGRRMEALEALITTTNSGAKFNSGSYKIAVGLHGVGLACICALSKYMHMITYRDGEAVEFTSENGVKKALNHYPKINEVNGVLTEFIADPELWSTTEIPLDSIIDRCKVANAMGYRIRLYYNNEEIKIDTKSIFDLLPTENVSDYCSDIIRIDNKETGEYFLVGFKYTSDTKSKSYGYTDLLPNRYGGTHIKIITDNLCRAWREFYNDDSVWWNDSLLGVRLVVAAFISNVSFSSQTKEKLTVPYKQLNFFGEEFLKEFKKWMKKNRNLSDKLFARFKEYRQSLIKLQNQKDIAGKVKIATIDKEGKTRRSQIVDKLMDCTSNKVEDTEILIVEGDSAAGTVARPRDRKTQAVLPLRGKIQNVSGMSYKDALKHQTVANIINSIGCFTGDTRICCLDGKTYSFEELLNFGITEIWTYCKDSNGYILPVLGKDIRITKYIDELAILKIGNTEIKCTPDHKILLNDGSYKEAQHLTINDSISSLYFRDYNGYLQFYDKESKLGFNYIHRLVGKTLVQDENPNEGIRVIHHKDFNTYNNLPNNLEWWNKGKHYRFHGKLKQGEEHLNKFKHSCSREQRIENLSKVNDNPNFWKEKFVENPELLKNLSNRMTNKNLNPEYQEKCNEGFRKFLSNPENKRERQRKILLTKSIRFIESLGFPNREITESEYNEKRKSNTRVIPTWNTAIKCGLKEYMSNYNHKIQEPVKIIKLKKSIPVYDLTVDKYHNFLISTNNNYEYVKEGIFVHNCGIGESADPKKCRYERIIISTDSDDDGAHIVALILIALVNLVPPIVRAGMVYLLDPPLYKYLDKNGNPIYTSDFDSVPENAKGFIRFKGLGSMEDEDFKNTCLNKNNRTLYQITYPDDIDQFNYIAGTSAGRSELLKRYGVIKDISAELEESDEEI